VIERSIGGIEMATAVYFLCALTSTGCAVILFWTFWRHRDRVRMLVLWSGLSFALFAISNALVFVDLVLLRAGDLAVARAATACLASAVLLYGLIEEAG
jgi:hypothetical protein